MITVATTMTDEGRADVTITAGRSRIEMSFWSNQPMPVDQRDRELIEMVIAQFLSQGVSKGRIRSASGRLAVWALARHIRFAMETEQPIQDFGGLPITPTLPRSRHWLAGITSIQVA